MSDEGELKVGDRTTTAVGRDVIVLALDGDHAWIKAVDNGDHWTYRIKNLTRISPAEPQPKFRVGQRVRRVLYGMSGKPMEVIAIRVFEYECRDHEGYHFRIGEDGLEAVPEVCPTCGGKVGDG